ncbi:hypothetical protein JZU46_05700 [bacterium]|nr:hypothetical protein [bacterium]
MPITVGQVFSPGALAAADGLAGRLNDGTALPLQFEVKATHADGSVRHAVISAVLPNLNAAQTQTISFLKGAGAAPAAATIGPASLLAAGFTSSVVINLGGVSYTASADTLLRAGQYTSWLAGPVVNEWLVVAPLQTSQGVAHPHLTARFAIRAYTGQNNARVDVTIENGWAYEPGPQNFTYDTHVLVGGQTVYSKAALTHYHHARWRKTFWWGNAPQVHVMHNSAYLIATKAVPNYDQSLTFAPRTLAALKERYESSSKEPMGNGLAMRAMGSGGGRPDIGILPGWAVTYLLTMDKDAKDATLGTASLAGSWSVHYRDKNIDRPVSIVDFPYMTIYGLSSDTLNPVTNKLEAFPKCGGVCINPNLFDSAHEPSFGYLPYMLTGDHYYLEELLFWTMFNLAQFNPAYRSYALGLLHKTEVRGQAWMLRTLAEATYITPDLNNLKIQLETFLSDNLDWYNSTYTNAPKTDNALGFIYEQAIVYNTQVGIAPWQDDFFTSTIGWIEDIGYSKAKSLLIWKARFPVSRMNGPDFCWIVASNYTLNVRDNLTSPIYTTIGQVYRASMSSNLITLPCGSTEMAKNLSLQVGEMVGYAYDSQGYPSNMQPALAYIARSGIPGADIAWTKYINRSVKPDYSNGPQFAIVPR